MTEIEAVLHELIRGVAHGTAELIAEEYDDMAGVWAERKQIGEQMVEATLGAARDFPESELARLRNLIMAEGEPEWRCFHCGFVTSDPKEARGHFGDMDEGFPLCVTWAEAVRDDATIQLYQDECYERERCEDELIQLRQEKELLEYRIGSTEGEIMSRFPGCRTIDEAWQKYDSLEGLALAAEEELAALRPGGAA